MEARTIEFIPAFHRCSNEPGKDYGICNARMVWTLRVGPDAISWELMTGWGMPDEAFHAAAPGCTHPRHRGSWPEAPAMGGAVDWHCSRPMYDGHDGIAHCKVLDGPCYPDVGFLIGDVLFDLLRVEGDEAVWAKMESLLAEYLAREDARSSSGE